MPTHVTCPNCGYNLTGVAIGSSCPECGLLIGRGSFGMPISGKAIASLVLGIISIIGCTAYGILSLPCGITAMFLASSVKNQILRGEVSPSSASIARAGMICGIIGTCLGGLVLLFVIAAIAMGIMGSL